MGAISNHSEDIGTFDKEAGKFDSIPRSELQRLRDLLHSCRESVRLEKLSASVARWNVLVDLENRISAALNRRDAASGGLK